MNDINSLDNADVLSLSQSITTNATKKQQTQSYYDQWYGSSLIEYNFTTPSENNVCNLPNLIFISHHKTGGYFKSWIPYFKRECRNNTTPFNITFNKRYGYAFENIRNEYDKLTYNNVIAIMMVREPIFHILSGYNYHASGQERQWTNRRLTLPFLHPQINKNNETLIYCFKNVWNESEYVIDMYHTTMYEQYTKGYRHNFANKKALNYGLYLEFTRYVNCEWPQIFSKYNGLKYSKLFKYFVFLRFEWFKDYNYTQSIAYFLNVLTIKPNIYMNKTNLFQGLLEDKGQKGHFVRHRRNIYFNMSEQIDLLLNYSKNVCLKIKNMTVVLDYQWNYTQYC